MRIRLSAIIIFFIIYGYSLAQYIPKDKAKLNYNQIMFEVPYKEGAKSYCFILDEINTDGTNTNLLKQTEKFPIAFIKDLKFGSKYMWKVEYKFKSGKSEFSEPRIFLIESTTLNDPKFYTKKQHYNNRKKTLAGIIWCDQYHYAVDRNGDMVWFLNPALDKDFTEKRQIRDFKQYNDGSITFISDEEAYHVDRDLNILWKAPNDGNVSGGKSEKYHHEIQLLKTGNYLILSGEQIEFQNDDEKDTSKFAKAEFSNLIEYDTKGNVIWYWKMTENFPYELLINSKIETRTGVVSPHANGFYIDEATNMIYVSFRDISRIIKIDKTTKKILASWGTKLQDNDSVVETDIFYAQHNVQSVGKQSVIIFNNNDVKKGKTSSVDVLYLGEFKNVTRTWTFDIKCDSFNDGKALKMGGVKILPNKNMLINEGTLNRVIEINTKKEVVWDFQMLKKDSLGNIDKEYAIYRTNFSSSLYPYYFKIFIDDKNNLHVLNKGDFADEYEVVYFDSNGKEIKKVSTKTMSPAKEMILKSDKIFPPDCQIEVRSKQSSILRKLNFKR